MSNPERPLGEFDPRKRMIEISLANNTTKSSIRRVADLTARYLYENPKMYRESFSNFGTRTFLMFEVEGDRELIPDEPSDPYERKLRVFIKRVIPDADSPHKWLFASVDSEGF